MSGNEEHSRQTILYFRWELESLPQNHPGRRKCLAGLADALKQFYVDTREIGALREAIIALRTAIRLGMDDHVELDRHHRELRRLLLWLFQAAAHVNQSNLEQALRWLYPSPIDRKPRVEVEVVWLAELASALWNEYQQTDDLPTLRDAVTAARHIATLTDRDDPDFELYQENLASMLLRLSGRDGDLEALDEAAEIMRPENIGHTNEDHGTRRNLLALILKQRYTLTGEVGALRRAVQYSRAAVSSAHNTSQDLTIYKGNLADQLRMLSERINDLAMAREAVSLSREAATGLRKGDTQWAELQSILGSSTTNLARRSADEQTISDAVNECQRAVLSTPVDCPEYLPRLSMLCQALMLKCEKYPEPSVVDWAVKVARDLAGTVPEDHPDRGKYLSQLSSALRVSFLRSSNGSVQDLKESTEVARIAVASTPPNHPDRAANLSSLSELLHLLFEKTGDTVSLREYVTTNSAVAKMSGASISHRVAAAQRAAQADLHLGRPRRAMAMVQLATELLPQLGFRDVDRADREHRLSTVHQLPATAAAAAIATGQPGLAVELLEQTRGVVFAGTLDTRGDTAELRHAALDLLPRFLQIRDEINAVDHEITLPSFSGHRDATGRHSRELAARRATLSREWEAILERIRQRPGLAGFLKPTPISDLCGHADQGPIISIVAEESRAYALIIRNDPEDPVTVVELNAVVTRATVLQQADLFRTALALAVDREQPTRVRRAAQPRISGVLAWIWDNITEPVLNGLGITNPPSEDAPWTRVWWCPVGVISMLPLHASGHHGSPTRGKAVIDRLVSSYTPTIRALAHARRDNTKTVSTLVVAVPDAPESFPLHGAVEEAKVVRSYIPAAEILPSNGPTVNREEVIEALRNHGIVHLACHGYADLRDPAASRLLLHDHLDNPLTLHVVTHLNLQHAQLAYLSACSTTGTSQEQADEATHLTAAFQLAGYRNVIGTLWPINDQAATSLAADFYKTITNDGTGLPEPGRAAQALHRAVRNLRDMAPALPSRWAAFVHSGA